MISFTCTAHGATEIFAELDMIEHMFDLDQHDLGRHMLDNAAFEITVNMANETDSDGFPWAPLSSWYEEWKKNVAPGAPIGYLYGLMTNWEQIAGERLIYQYTASMTYGIDVIAKIEAVKFQEGGIVTGTNQPARPFYGLTLAACLRANDRFDVIFTNFV
jgi:hypothetical protein